MTKFIVAVVAAALVGYVLFSYPNVTFRSSDGKWADSEDQFNGRSFEAVIFNFEGYKLKCGAPNAVLLRATTQQSFNVFAWPSYSRDRKWHVPYSNAHPEIGNYFPPASQKNCYNEGWPPAVTKAAQLNADRYLSRL